MAIEHQSNYRAFSGTGALSVYQVDFPVLDPSHIVAAVKPPGGKETELRQGVDCQASIRRNSAGESVGAVVTLSKALAAGHELTITRVVPIRQQAVFTNQGGMQPKAVERQLDYLTMICQQLFRQYYLDAAALAELERFVGASHVHAIADVTGLRTALDSRAALSHVHAIANVAGLQAALGALAGRAEYDARFAALEARFALTMPAAPSDGRLYFASGRAWHLVGLEPGEPFDWHDGGVSPVRRPSGMADIWNAAGDGAALKPAFAEYGGMWDATPDGLTLKPLVAEDAFSLYFNTDNNGVILKGALA